MHLIKRRAAQVCRPYGISGGCLYFVGAGPRPARQYTHRERLLGKPRRKSGTAPAAIFANPGPSGPEGIAESHSDFARRKYFSIFQVRVPRNGGPGVSRHWRTKFASAASPGDPLVPFPSLGKEPAPQGGTPCQTARRGRRALQNEESSARRPQAAKLPQNTEKDKPRGAYPQGLSWFKI